MTTLDSPVRDQGIGAYVRERRRVNRLTQQELAELAGVGLRFLKDLEHGKSTVQLAHVNAVLAVFGKHVGVVDRPRTVTPDDRSATADPTDISGDSA